MLGVTLATAVALGIAWPASFLTPILTAVFLGPPGKPLPFKAGVAFVLTIVGACAFALLVSLILLPYPAAFMLMIAWLLAVIFYSASGRVSPIVVMWLLIAFSVIPLLSIQSGALALGIAQYLVMGAAAAVGFAWLAHALVPGPRPEPVTEPAPAAAQPQMTTAERARQALISTTVVYPILMLFLFFSLTGQIVILVFVALLAMNPSLGAGKQAGMALIAANVAGGLAAILIYNLLVAVPEFAFLLCLMLLAALLFGRALYSDWKYAKLAGSAFSAVLLIIGSTTTSTNEAGAKVLTRVLQITAAVLYLVIAFGVIESLGRRRRN